ncbi:SusD/RagB family nutrient-binding outer membrane lipoprotein [Puteibacter caeruleilacunae]|nr:SusD/RagB family nutrient-binding outer membrane lipoprotein [Puteibacter caeruleilacunae]
MNKIITIAIAFIAILFGLQSCDKDEFAEKNSNPSVISEPNISFLISRAMQQMYSNDYTIWFYQYNGYVWPYSQAVTAGTGGNLTTFNEGGLSSFQGLRGTLIPGVDARMRIDLLEDEEQKALHQGLKGISLAVNIFTGIENLDYVGGLSYSEAGLANFTNPPLLTPKIDLQEELFTLWANQLDEAIGYMELDNQFSLGNQDLVYKGDFTKWIKFCNLLKLRIAARLINADRAKALAIAAEVGASTYMDDLGDDFLFNKGINYRGDGNAVGGGWTGYAGNNLIEFLKSNKDPRLRFLFRKNNFNPEVIDAIIETNGLDGLPTQIRSIMNTTAEGKFDSWMDGYEEPWVRYWGVPVSTAETSNEEYFQQESEFFATKEDGSGKKTYIWSSVFEEKNQRTRYTYTYPTKPGGSVIQVLGDQVTRYVLLGSAAETNLYLAEFKLLGASLPMTAQEYLTRGVTFSVQRMDDLAERHENPYYGGDPVLIDPEEGATMLKDGEITNLLTGDAYTLDGTDDLEKVYIQQYVNDLMTPINLWTTVRRSGIPKVGSSYFAWEDFGVSDIPRRVPVGTPEPNDLMYDILVDYINKIGFTTSDNTAAVLANERLWFDINNPDYGAGPKE